MQFFLIARGTVKKERRSVEPIIFDRTVIGALPKMSPSLVSYSVFCYWLTVICKLVYSKSSLCGSAERRRSHGEPSTRRWSIP